MGSRPLRPPLPPPSNVLQIYVIGKQWMWKVQHSGGQREINALHLPVRRPVQLIMTSEDVIHDFAVPAFRIKHDVLPGRYESCGSRRTCPARITSSVPSSAVPITRR
jgi:heme/copper-type cytochrome/quinol oxidase subunit 2